MAPGNYHERFSRKVGISIEAKRLPCQVFAAQLFRSSVETLALEAPDRKFDTANFVH